MVTKKITFGEKVFYFIIGNQGGRSLSRILLVGLMLVTFVSGQGCKYAYDPCDSNRDGFVDQDESEACDPDEKYHPCDFNQDGMVDQDESEVCDPDDNYDPCDFNKDGMVDQDESEVCDPDDNYDPCDFNKDGMVDQDESEVCDPNDNYDPCDFNKDGIVDQDESEECEPDNSVNADLDVYVNVGLEPSVPDMPGFEIGMPRPLATIIDEKGNQADFIENELVLSSDNPDELADFLARWNGEVLSIFNPDDYGLTDMKTQYLIRIDTSLADSTRLREDLLVLNPNSQGQHMVSSEAGLNLLSAGAEEAASGLEAGVNWVGRGDTFRDRRSTEAPSGTFIGSTVYNSNVFNWPSHDEGSTQDIGVAEAWRALELADKLDNKIKIAVLDMGFAVTNMGDDLPDDWTAISNVPFVDPLGTMNLLSCGGSSCPWHGTNVVYAAMAKPDNNFGSAGPAGPIARPIMVFTLYDFFTSMFALGEARLSGARIANMSYSARVPASLSWSVIPFNVATSGFRASGMLLFASAGNDGQDVDAEDCTPLIGWPCWEEAWHTPCENDGVICVGGIDWDSRNKHPNSNFGPEEVDIFAPFTLWLGTTPRSSEGNYAEPTNGTSFSSPYAAGVAALIWAANPRLSASQVESILYSTAHGSPDRSVNRYVNAHDAVLVAIGDNVPPLINIESPLDGESYSNVVGFRVDVEDLEDGTPEDGTPSISWTSSIDDLSDVSSSTFTRRLSFGTHWITATATDSDGNSSSDTVSITIVNESPTVTITSVNPLNPYQSQSIALTGTSYDPNTFISLPDSQVAWYLDGSSSPLEPLGHSAFIPGGTLSVGSHTITFVGRDGEHRVTDSVEINVLADSTVNIPPTAIITSLAEGDNFLADTYDESRDMWYKSVRLCGYGDDREDGRIDDSSSVTWYYAAEGDSLFTIVPGAGSYAKCPVVRLYLRDPVSTYYTIRLHVTDSAGDPDEIEIRVSVYGLI